MMTNEHEQNPHSNSTNQGGKFADQNVKPEAPATNDPWGIASGGRLRKRKIKHAKPVAAVAMA